MNALAQRAEGLRAQRTPFVLATVVRAERPTSAKAGDRALVLPDGTIEGFVGGECAESTVRTQGLRLLRSGESTLLRITPEPSTVESTEGLVVVDNPCLSGGTLEIFLESVVPPVLVHVFGSAPIARALERVGAAVGYDVRLTNDPLATLPPDASAVVVAAHGRDETAVLSAALAAGVPYVALVASPRRGTAVLAGLDPADAARVSCPAGLDIGARTPAEIAVSILAELISTKVPVAVLDTVPAVSAAGRDPVCGMEGSLTLEYGGRTWYFCGAGCRQAFADDPGRYGA